MNRRDVIKLLGATPLLNTFDVHATAHNEIANNSATNPENQANQRNPGSQLLVFGATPGGITCSIRAAREGLKVTLVSAVPHLGGMLSNGLGTMDTLYNGARSPLYDEFRKSIYDFYRKKYGTASPEYAATGPGISKTKYEAHVAEQLINEWLNQESNITIIKEYYPVEVKKTDGKIEEVIFRSSKGQPDMAIKAIVFADCSYEGDLLALSGADHIIGRESKQQYGEKYAGIVYSKDIKPGDAPDALSKEDAELFRNLNLYRYSETRTQLMMPESTGAADDTIQGFNLRCILTDDPALTVLASKPANYSADHFKEHYTHKTERMTLSRPKSKSSMAYPEILGTQNDYIKGDWKTRQRILQQYKDEVLGLLYYRQNDAALPAEVREHWRKMTLAKDEFTDNDYIPYEVYVREGRRIKGKFVFTEHDAMLAPGLRRAPIHEDSIITTDWFLDSHACTDRTVRGSKEEGEVMLKTETVPGQVPLRVLFPSQPANLIVPVCVSASHIGWGAIRLEPVWMSLGEVAGYIAVEACTKKMNPSNIDAVALSHKLVERRFMLSFFNDVEGRETANWYPAIQWLGTKGFFSSYEAMPDKKLTKALAKRWIAHLQYWKEHRGWDANKQAIETAKVEFIAGENISAKDFASAIEKVLGKTALADSWLSELSINSQTDISRADAARLIYLQTVNKKTTLKK